MNARGEPQASRHWIPRFFYWGILFLLSGGMAYFVALPIAMLHLVLPALPWVVPIVKLLLWCSGFSSMLGAILVAADLLMLLPAKRKTERRPEGGPFPFTGFTVGLTAYNDEDSIAAAVGDFASHPLVRRVVVVSNNSRDRTLERARDAGAIVFDEERPGYGQCVWRCLGECLKFEDTNYIVLCEGDRTFRAFDLGKFHAYLAHADIVNGTRIVEQLRAYSTQLSTFMFYGNFFVGKLLEAKHLGKGTFTDVGTTYKVIERAALARLLPLLDPRVNQAFNAHFMDTALDSNYAMVECPITFHPRVGVSKGGNVNNLRALKVGFGMIFGLTFGWRWLRGCSKS
jgi:hypothetical protein